MYEDLQGAYFSMEIGLDPAMPTYAGGLGMLAGDLLRAAADMRVPLIGVTLLHREGYFYQRLDPDGTQHEAPVRWVVEDHLKRLEERVSVRLEGRTVQIAAWRFDIEGVSGFDVPVILLDTRVPENSAQDRALTDHLYGGDQRYRLMQEVVLGVGGVRMLRQIGCTSLRRYHMNEGHAALLALELLSEEAAAQGRAPTDREVVESVRRRCVFTTHTPVAAGHDQFPLDLVRSVVDPDLIAPYRTYEGRAVVLQEGRLNMTFLGFNLCHYINGVAKRHGEVSRHMFGEYPIDSITNGVHIRTWAHPAIAGLFDKHVPGWREDGFSLRYMLSVDTGQIATAHRVAKHALIDYVNRESNAGMDADALTIGFARRATAYKRADLVLADLERLKRISAQTGPVQIVFAGKAHPHDGAGADLIREIFRAAEALGPEVPCAYLANYDMDLCRMMVAGVDLWLNTPQPPLEASGTSGMKAAVNGVPSLSTLDGWWVEGCIEGVTGWAIGEDRFRVTDRIDPQAGMRPDDRARDAAALYDKLEKVVVPLFYKEPERYAGVMRQAIAFNGSFFSARRMLLQYVTKAYFE